jgi:membrane protease subunit (stomatin/prohibitin family)
MPLFQGHPDKGLDRLFIEIPDENKGTISFKWPDQQIIKHSLVNVDADYQALFTNLGKVIGTLAPGRWPLDEGASLLMGWLVDRLTGDAYYNAEIYFVTTRELTGIEFGGPVDNLTDTTTGIVVGVRVFGEVAFRVSDPAALILKLTGTGSGDFDGEIERWITDQVLAAIRAVLPGIVAEHGVLALGQVQDATIAQATAAANTHLSSYGLSVTQFGELNVNVDPTDVGRIKSLSGAVAFTKAAGGSFADGVRGEALLDIAAGVAAGNVGAMPAVVAGMMMGVPPVVQRSPARK